MRPQTSGRDGSAALLGDRNVALYAEGKGDWLDANTSTLEAGALKQGDQIIRIEGAVCIWAGERPFRHSNAIGRVYGHAATGPQHPKDLRDIAADSIEEIDDIDEEKLVEGAVRPWQGTKCPTHQLQPPRRYRRSVPAGCLPEHSRGMIDAVDLAEPNSREKQTKALPGPKSKVEDPVARLKVKGIDRQAVWLRVEDRHEVTDDTSLRAGRAAQLLCQGLANPIENTAGPWASFFCPGLTISAAHDFCWIFANTSWITSLRLLSHSGRSG